MKDASYLELAMRHNIPLATQDDRLREAAQGVGVSLLRPVDEDHAEEPAE